jgi:hypothetical protein
MRAGVRARGQVVREELLSGTAAIGGLMLALAGIYWLVTGLNPWPVFILSELPGAGFGLVLLALMTPSKRR